MNRTKLALAAAFGLALTFTFSCSSDNDSGGDVSYYDPGNENTRCRNGVVESKCGDEWYNSAKYICTTDYDEFSNLYYKLITWNQYDELMEQQGYVRCGSSGHSYYSPDYDYTRCQSGVIEFKCGDEWYNFAKYRCTSNLDEFSNPHYTLITREQWYEQNGYVRCR